MATSLMEPMSMEAAFPSQLGHTRTASALDSAAAEVSFLEAPRSSIPIIIYPGMFLLDAKYCRLHSRLKLEGACLLVPMRTVVVCP